MAIGDVSARAGKQPLSNRQGVPSQFIGAGVTRALGELANAYGDFEMSQVALESKEWERQKQVDGYSAESEFVKFQTKMAQDFTDQTREANSDPRGFTNNYDKYYEKQWEQFSSTLPEHLRETYQVRGDKFRGQQVLSAYSFETTQMDVKVKNDINDSLNTLGSALRGGQIDFEDATAQINDIIASSPLPDIEKEDLYRSTSSVLGVLQFGNELSETVAGRGTVGEADGKDVVAAGLSPGQRGVLNAISARESSGAYNVMFGNRTFTDFSDHPRQYFDSHNGRTSAAGRYQFLASTWDAAVRGMKEDLGIVVPNFSPEWQDRVAIYWIERRYNELSRNGMNFQQTIASGDDAAILSIRDVLGKPRGGNPLAVEFEGLGHMSDSEFLGIFKGERGVSGGGTGMSKGPNVWTDPKYAQIPINQKMQMASQVDAALKAVQRQVAETARLEEVSRREELFNLGGSGQAGYDDIPRLRQSGLIQNEEDEKKFREAVTYYSNKEEGIGAFQNKLAGGEALSADDNENYDNWIGDEGRTRLWQNDEGEARRISSAATSAGFIPPTTRDLTSRMLNSSDIEQRQFALEMLSSLHNKNDRFLSDSGFSADDQATVRYFDRLRKNSSSAAEVFSIMDEARKQVEARPFQQVEKEANKFFDELFEDDIKIINKVRGWFGPTTIPTGSVRRTLNFEAREAFQIGYLKTGTVDGAEAYMEQSLKKNWGPTSVGTDKTLIRNPPENYYPPVSGSHEYLETTIREQFELQEGDEFVLIPDQRTVEEVDEFSDNRTGLPTYMVMVTREDGVQYFTDGRFGGIEIVQESQEANRREVEKKALLTKLEVLEEARRTAGAEIFERGTPERMESLSNLEKRTEALRNDLAERFGVPDENPHLFEEENFDEGRTVERAKQLLSAMGQPGRISRQVTSMSNSYLRANGIVMPSKEQRADADRRARIAYLMRELLVTETQAKKLLEDF